MRMTYKKEQAEIIIECDDKNVRSRKVYSIAIIFASFILAITIVFSSLFIIKQDQIKTEKDNIPAHESIGEKCYFNDTRSPRITLNGEPEVTIEEQSKYEEKGAEAIDDCDGKLKVQISGTVDVKKPGKYTVNYIAIDNAGNVSEISRLVTVKQKDIPKNQGVSASTGCGNNIKSGARIIYLTFDDGPSPYTNQLLDILKKNNVKATFFVTGNYAGNRDAIKRAYKEGHTIAVHSYTHNYDKIYVNEKAYFEDLDRVINLVKELTGSEPKLIRFPGGSSNTVSRNAGKGRNDKQDKIMSILTKEVEKRGYKYFDWNVLSGDAGETKDTHQVYCNVISRLKSEYSIVLQHDVKKFSVDAVDSIIKYSKGHGFTFKALDEDSPTVHHRVNN